MSRYTITATCDNPSCTTVEFQLQRNSMTYLSHSGIERVINRIACPDCRMLGQVDKIVTNQERQEVA